MVITTRAIGRRLGVLTYDDRNAWQRDATSLHSTNRLAGESSSNQMTQLLAFRVVENRNSQRLGRRRLMMEDARSIPSGTEIKGDVCIIGGGAAGITVAMELANRGKKVILLSGGSRRERAEDRDLYRGSTLPRSAQPAHEPLDQNRRRVWGGTTSVWGGRCVPLDEIDFSERSHVPFSGWPLTFGDLRPYLVRANRVCEAGAFAYSAAEALPGRPPEMIAGFDGLDLVTNRIERWSPPTRFGRRYEATLKAAPRVRVLVGAHALHIQLDRDGGRRVAHIRAATRPGHAFEVIASSYVLACGGLENPRLLLASNDVHGNGIGNQHGNVGRYYMSHLVGVLGEVTLEVPTSAFTFDFERDAASVYCRRRFWVTPEAQARLGIGNAIAFLLRPSIGDPGHRNAVYSATHLAKTYVDAFRRRSLRAGIDWLRQQEEPLREHWRVLARGAPAAAPRLARLARRRWLSQRRLPIVLGSADTRRFALFFQTEHAPNPDSRVALGSTRDAFGMPRLQVNIAFGDLDIETVVRFHTLLADRLVQTDIGRLHWDPLEARHRLRDQLDNFNSHGHHLGTTRMATRPEDGVVDRNGRVHNVANLYVAGASVFPTGGHANPTLTLVALAIRLADHLAGEM